VSTHQNSLVVVVCEHGVSPALKSPEVSLPKTTFSWRHPFFRRVRFIIIPSLIELVFSSELRSPFCD